MPICFKCRQDKTPEEFQVDRSSTRGLQGYCKECQKEYRRNWYNNLPDRAAWRREHNDIEAAKRHEQARLDRNWELRLEMIAAYGGCCSCCGITEPEFLTLEHVNGGGRKQRRELGGKAYHVYRYLKSLG